MNTTELQVVMVSTNQMVILVVAILISALLAALVGYFISKKVILKKLGAVQSDESIAMLAPLQKKDRFFRSKSPWQGALQFAASLVAALLLIIVVLSITTSVGWLDAIKALASTDGRDPIGALEVLVTFMSIVGAAIFFWVREETRRHMEKEWQVERVVSASEIHRVLGVVYMRIYETVYGKATKTADMNVTARGSECRDWDAGSAWEFLSSGTAAFERALEMLKDVPEDRCLRQRVVTKNNLAHSLARKWEYQTDKKHGVALTAFFNVHPEMKPRYKADKSMALTLVAEITEQKYKYMFPDTVASFAGTKRICDEAFQDEVA